MSTLALPTHRTIPRLPGVEHSLALLADPYRFIARACARLGSPVVEARLLLQPTLCLAGAEAARLFYDPARFTRVGAVPEPLRATLFGHDVVQALDGAAHATRKAFFLEATRPQRLAALADEVERAWGLELGGWPRRRPFALYRAVQPVLARAVCQWAGVPLPDHEVPLRTRQLAALFDQAVAGPLAHLRARQARVAAEAWLAVLVEETRRSDPVWLEPGTVGGAAAQLAGEDGAPLPARVAAAELLNVLRPIVAISVYLVHAARALHLHPRWREPILAGDGPATRAFLQEVRRTAPFVPAVAARTACDFEWHGWRFPAGARALLDLHGTHLDPAAWPHPETFDPGRFRRGLADPWAFIPQGGGDAATHHRCPGEDAVLVLLERLLRLLLASGCRAVPRDLALRMRRVPALPAHGWLVARP